MCYQVHPSSEANLWPSPVALNPPYDLMVWAGDDLWMVMGPSGNFRTQKGPETTILSHFFNTPTRIQHLIPWNDPQEKQKDLVVK